MFGTQTNLPRHKVPDRPYEQWLASIYQDWAREAILRALLHPKGFYFQLVEIEP